tara:strand:+ start:628 stop:1584 length:957 start_codon:yes stop_codon:yes gene_type:complete
MILAFIENWEGQFKKSSFETTSYGKTLSKKLGCPLTIITFGSHEPNELIKYGADKIINIANITLEETPNSSIVEIIVKIIEDNASKTIITSNTNLGKSISPLLASKLNAGLFSNVIDLPENTQPMIAKCKAFSGKAYAKYESSFEKNIISILPNSIGEITKYDGEGVVSNEDAEIESNNSLKIISRSKSNDTVALPDADIVVSAGRGLKNAENWDIIEELASTLNAATACSKPVSDMGWRPHSEHVGQTGIAINPQLYIAIGISGAIQHLAGVSSSKNIVVINTDSDAPFFKAANYGIVGDAFEVVPKLIDAIKKHTN